MNFIPPIIISGGQTGADQGGLRAAEQLGIPTGGYAPRGWMTERGPDLQLRDRWGLMEHESQHDYAPRTGANVKLSEATVIFGRRSRGSNLTERLCTTHRRPLIWIPIPYTKPELYRFRLWLNRYRPACLNVAGNRESVTPGIGAEVERFLLQTLR